MSEDSNILNLLEKHELMDVKDKILSGLKPSLRLRLKCGQEPAPVGRTKVGGIPDMPPGFAWPVHTVDKRPLSFLAQLNLTQIASYGMGDKLPSTGMLYFFYDAVRQDAWGYDPKHMAGWMVIYVQSDGDLKPMTLPLTLTAEGRFAEASVSIDMETTIPCWETEDDELAEKMCAFLEDYYNYSGDYMHITRMFGNPEFIQGDVRETCQAASKGIYVGKSTWLNKIARPFLLKGLDDWELLLQLDSDEAGTGMMWGDGGRLYFMIRRQDLQRRAFNKVWMVLSCY